MVESIYVFIVNYSAYDMIFFSVRLKNILYEIHDFEVEKYIEKYIVHDFEV